MTTRRQRRLAAILAADAVGFSRMMEADEADTLARLPVTGKDSQNDHVQFSLTGATR